jgi:hypothetical protein
MEMSGPQFRPGARRRGFTALEFSGVMAVIGLMVGLIVAWGFHARHKARGISCMSNLKQIGLAMHLYAADYGNRMPHSNEAIVVLAAVYTHNQQMYVCPSDEDPAVIKAEAPGKEREQPEEESDPSAMLYGPSPPLTEMECSYFIVPGLTNDDPPAELMAGETAARHRGRWNSVCVDGRLESRPASELPTYRLSGSER